MPRWRSGDRCVGSTVSGGHIMASTLAAGRGRTSRSRTSQDHKPEEERRKTKRQSVRLSEIFEYCGSITVDPGLMRIPVRNRLCAVCQVDPTTLVPVVPEERRVCGVTSEFRKFHLDPSIELEVPAQQVSLHCHRLTQERTMAEIVDLLGGADKVRTTFVDLMACQFGLGTNPSPADHMMAEHGLPTLVLVGPNNRVVPFVRIGDDRFAFDSRVLNGDICKPGTHVLSRNPVQVS